MARHRRRSHRRHTFRNPLSPSALLSGPKEMMSKEFLTQAVSTAAGFIAPNIALGYLPVALRDTKVKFYASKVVMIGVLAGVVGMVNRKYSKPVLVGGGVSLLLDIWAEWKARSMPAAPAAGTQAWYGNDMGAWYGNQNGLSDDLVLSDDQDAGF